MQDRALAIITNEYQSLHRNPLTNIGLCVGLPDPKNLFEWRCTMTGPSDTPYAGGLFYIKVMFPKDYPNTKPEVRFITPIYHLNVNHIQQYGDEIDPLGHVCISTINKWNSSCNMAKVFQDIFVLYYQPGAESPFGFERRDEYKKNPKLYEQKAKYFTKKYANPCLGLKQYKSWDFTYPSK